MLLQSSLGHNFLPNKPNHYFLVNLTDVKNTTPINTYSNYLQIFNQFTYLKSSLFISFFVNNMIDIPICFKKSYSLKRPILNIPLLKFVNLLMRKGKKEQITKTLFKSLKLLLAEFKQERSLSILFSKSFIKIFLFISNLFPHLNLDFEQKISLLYGNSFSSLSKSISNDFFLKNFFLSQILKIAPIFSYFVYNVDKNIRKYSRGKSGKYIFV
jgi:hypothetical protein